MRRFFNRVKEGEKVIKIEHCAQRSMPSGALLAIFNGIRLREITGIPFVTSNYKISVDRGLDLDIPDWAISAKKYSATLGHKCCHSFSPNAEFLVLEHARYKINLFWIKYPSR